MRFEPMHIEYLFSVEDEPYRGSFGWRGRYMPPVNIDQ